jgi:hypothetical protein
MNGIRWMPKSGPWKVFDGKSQLAGISIYMQTLSCHRQNLTQISMAFMTQSSLESVLLWSDNNTMAPNVWTHKSGTGGRGENASSRICPKRPLHMSERAEHHTETPIRWVPGAHRVIMAAGAKSLPRTWVMLVQ